MVRVAPRSGLLAVLLGIGLIAGGIGLGALIVGNSRPATFAVPTIPNDAAAQLVQAQELAPYRFREPEWMPDGYALARVSWDSDPTNPAGHVFTVDMDYVDADNEVIHIWQTNLSPDQLGPTNPVTAAGASDANSVGAGWKVLRLPELEGVSRVQLAHRDEHGITLSIDGRSQSDLELIAKSLTTGE